MKRPKELFLKYLSDESISRKKKYRRYSVDRDRGGCLTKSRVLLQQSFLTKVGAKGANACIFKLSKTPKRKVCQYWVHHSEKEDLLNIFEVKNYMSINKYRRKYECVN